MHPPGSAEDDFVADPDQDNLDETIDSLFSDSFEESATQEQEDAISDDENMEDTTATIDSLLSDTGELFSADEKIPVVPSSDNGLAEQELFGKLRDALDISLDEKENVPAKADAWRD